jgi:hypothetical protein
MEFSGEFAGFPPGVRATPIPDPVLGVLLEQIDDLAELKVTLRGFWLANQKKGALRAVSQDEFLNDKVLVEGLKGICQSSQEAIQRGLALAVRRRTFLVFPSGSTRAADRLYGANTESNRRALALLGAEGGVVLPEGIEDAPYTESSHQARPNIFTLYENNISTISPMLAEKLKEAEELYPWPWIAEALQIAVTQNKRSRA